MKSLFLVVLAGLGSIGALAGNDEPRKTGLAIVPVKDSEIFKIVYRGETAGQVRINVYNSTGARVMTQTVAGLDGFILPLKFSGLAYGEYSVELIHASGRNVEKVNYQPKRNVRHIHVSRVADGGQRFLLSVAGTGSDVITVKIFDNEGELLYSETNVVNGDMAKLYRLAKAAPGYSFEVSDSSGVVKYARF